MATVSKTQLVNTTDGSSALQPSSSRDLLAPQRVQQVFEVIRRLLRIPQAVTVTKTLTAEDTTSKVDASAGAVTINLPRAADHASRIYRIKKNDTSINAVTVVANGADLIDGKATVKLTVPYESVTIQSDGVNWLKLGNIAPGYGDVLYVKNFGAIGDGVTNDSAAIQATIDFAEAAGGGIIDLGKGVYLVDNLTVNTGFITFWGHGYQNSRLQKRANGPLITITNSNFVEFHEIDFQGVGGTFTGKGLDFVSGCTYPKIIGCHFTDFESYAWDFDTSGGWHLMVDTTVVQPLGGLSTGKCVRVGRAGFVDSAARFRRVFNSLLGGITELYGCLDFMVQGCNLSNLAMDSGCQVCSFVGTVYGAGGTAITLDGGSNAWNSCRWSAGPLTLAATLTNSSVEGVLTSGSIVDNSGRGDNHIAIRDGNFDAIYRGSAHQKHIAEMRVNGDVAQSLGITDARDQVWNSPLTAARNCNLPSTNLYAGLWGRVTRTAAATGASNLNVNGNGGLLIALTPGTWCEWGCDGTTLYITSYGALTASGGAPTTASYLTLGVDATLTNERVLTAGANITFVDTGAGGTLTINAASGSGNSGSATLSFGPTGSTSAVVTVIGQAWVTGTSKIVAMVLDDARAEDAVIESLSLSIANRVIGVGFDIYGAPQIGDAMGDFSVSFVGV